VGSRTKLHANRFAARHTKSTPGHEQLCHNERGFLGPTTRCARRLKIAGHASVHVWMAPAWQEKM
jgi:hypothetical protein